MHTSATNEPAVQHYFPAEADWYGQIGQTLTSGAIRLRVWLRKTTSMQPESVNHSYVTLADLWLTSP